MYYLKIIEDRVRIPPSMFGSTLENAVLSIVRERYEGRIYKDLGIVLSINNPSVLTDGIVIPGDCGAYYSVQFETLVFLPNVNEVYNAEIKEVVEFGAFASIGPFQGLLHVSQIDREKFYYDKKSKTLGSKALKRTLKKGDIVIVKVSTVSLKSTSSDTKIGLTMRPDGLGKQEWVEKKPPAKKVEKHAKAEKKGDGK
ncbi:DNA-directed RNA polymerase [Candidatus Micrarchaeota archaeon]|nr:DNA-directed RNA polymerase [Candidatus Micrarchaeota archaeon]MBU1166193.1 DNA-directed RNA polymerase [Candidatus Micrarchaeota archaeon]MBU1887124.1 DNA-directed RNA polymerase [Candidatus Micrarchaeota archaeon]